MQLRLNANRSNRCSRELQEGQVRAGRAVKVIDCCQLPKKTGLRMD